MPVIFYPKVIPSSLPRFIRAAFVIGLLAYLAVHFHLAVNIDNIIIGAVMPLVPVWRLRTLFATF